MSWFKRRRRKGDASPPAEPKAPSTAKPAPPAEAPSGRRAFFGDSWSRLRETGLETLKVTGKAMRSMQDALDGVEDATSEQLRELRAEELRGARRPHASSGARKVIRPPGALPEEAFLQTCEGCHACITACPEDAIQPAEDARRAGRVGTPQLVVHLRPCALCTDVPCASACPTGALRPLAPEAIRIGRVVVFRDLCIVSHGEPCEICSDECPVPGALVKGPDGFPVADDDHCTGCGLCVAQCPAYPAALHVRAR